MLCVFTGVTGTCFLSSSHSSVKHIKFICFFAELKFKKLCKMDFEALARQSLMALLQYVVVYSIRLNKVQLHIKKKIILIQLYKKGGFRGRLYTALEVVGLFCVCRKSTKSGIGWFKDIQSRNNSNRYTDGLNGNIRDLTVIILTTV